MEITPAAILRTRLRQLAAFDAAARLRDESGQAVRRMRSKLALRVVKAWAEIRQEQET